MFLPPDQRAIPPRWEEPKPERKRDPGNAAIVLILMIAVMGIVLPVGGGTLVAMIVMLGGWR